MTGTFTNKGNGAYSFDVSDATAAVTTGETSIPLEKYVIKEGYYRTQPGRLVVISLGGYVNHVWHDPVTVTYPATKVWVPATYGTRGGYYELKVSMAQTSLFTVPEPNIKSLQVVGSNYADKFDLGRLACSISISGGAGDDVLTCGSGGDTLTGGSGNDTLNGGSGSDTACFSGAYASYAITLNTDGSLIVSNATDGTDKLIGIENLKFSDKTVTASSLFNNLQLIGTSANDTLTGSSADEALYGYAGNDILGGGTGADTLYGGDGDDTLTGGAGNDTLSGDAGSDTAVFSGAYASYTITVNTDGSLTVSNATDGTDKLTGIENLKFSDKTVTASSLSASLQLSGTSGNDTLTGTSADETLNGYAGNDILYGGTGGDTLYGGDGIDTLWGQDGNDVVDGGAGNDTLYGGNGDDVLSVSAASQDVIDGGAGNDTVVLPWSSGNSTYQWGISNGVLFTNFRASSDTNYSSVSNVEAVQFTDRTMGLVLGGHGASTLTGTLASNIMIASTDTVAMIGGSGNDHIMGISSRDDNIRGMGGDDYIVGFDGNDTIEGGTGNDTMDGGAGTDTAVFSGNRAAYTVTQSASGDTTISGQDGIDILSGFEIVQFADQTVPVLNLGNVLSGTAANETLTGGNGNDTLYGYGGDDVLSGGTGDDDAFGGDGNDVLAGGAGDDAIFGGAGDDTLSGGVGNDTLDGDDGNDTATYSDATAGVVVVLSAVWTVGAGLGADTLVDVENLIGSNYTDILFGDDGANTLNGGLGDDWLVGGGGDDVLVGGGGNDVAVYLGATSGVTVDLSITTAQDVGGGVGKDRLVDIHHLMGSAGNDTLTGDSQTNIFFGDDGNDTIHGAAGGDWLDGQNGNDLLFGDDGNDTLAGDAGNDTLDGGAGTDTANFAGVAGDYYVAANSDGTWTVVGKDETDVLRNIEQVSFEDVTGTLSLGQFQAQGVSRLTVLEYMASYGDLMSAFNGDVVKGAIHYINNSAAEGRKVTFNPLAYIASYSDLIQAFGDDVQKGAEHYVTNGFKEGRDIHFSALNYIASYSDLIKAFGTDQNKALSHYIDTGWKEGRDVHFDPLNYIASYSDLIQAFGNDPVKGVTHFINSGYAEGRYAKFDAMSYIASYSDLIEAFGTDIVKAENHYIGSGYHEGREITYDPVAYLISNPDLGQAGYNTGNVTLQYIAQGYRQGRQESGGFGLEQTNHTLPMDYKTWDTIAIAGDRDWFNVWLTAGQSYTFTLSGTDGNNGTLATPFLGLFDAHGLLVANNDGLGHDAKLTITAATTGNFYVVAQASGTGTGTYTLFAAGGGGG